MPLTGVHTPARGATSQPSAPEEAARQTLTSRQGARGRRHSLRRRERGGASPGGGVERTRPLSSQREERQDGLSQPLEEWFHACFGGRPVSCVHDDLHFDNPLPVTVFLHIFLCPLNFVGEDDHVSLTL